VKKMNLNLSGLLGKLDVIGLVLLMVAAGANPSFDRKPIDWMTSDRFHGLYGDGDPHDLGLMLWNNFGDEVKAELGVSSKQEFYDWIKENTTRATEFFKRHGWYIWDPLAIGKPKAAVYYAAAPYRENFNRTGGDRYDPDNIGILGCLQGGGGSDYSMTFWEAYRFLHDGCLFDERLTRLAINYAHTRAACYYGIVWYSRDKYRDATSFKILKYLNLDPEIYGETPVVLTVYEPKFTPLKGGHLVLQTYGFIQEYWLTHDLETGKELPLEERTSAQRVLGGRPLFLIVPMEVAEKYIPKTHPQYGELNHIQDFLTMAITYGEAPLKDHIKFADEYSRLMKDLYDYYERKGYDPRLLARWTGIPLDHEMLKLDWLVKEGFPSPVESVLSYYAHGDLPFNHTGRELSQAYAHLLYAWMVRYGAWRNEYDHNHLVNEYLAAFYSPEELSKIPPPGWQPRLYEKTLIDETQLYKFISSNSNPNPGTGTTTTTTTTSATTIQETIQENTTLTTTTTSTSTSTSTSTLTETEAKVHEVTVTRTVDTTSSHELQLVYVDYRYDGLAQQPMMIAEPSSSSRSGSGGYNDLLLIIVAIGFFTSPLINRLVEAKQPPISNQFVFQGGCTVEITNLPGGGIGVKTSTSTSTPSTSTALNLLKSKMKMRWRRRHNGSSNGNGYNHRRPEPRRGDQKLDFFLQQEAHHDDHN
jgi:hypothetical protein